MLDVAVTGVQTCALPIYFASFTGGIGLRFGATNAECGFHSAPSSIQRFNKATCSFESCLPDVRGGMTESESLDEMRSTSALAFARSEERRVGKECRC